MLTPALCVAFFLRQGTNAILLTHELVTRSFIPRADLILFLTSVDRPFSQSEASFLNNIGNWKKKIVIVVNKIDMIKNETDKQTILQFVRKHANALMKDDKREIRIFPLSADLGLKAKKMIATSMDASLNPAEAAELKSNGERLLADSGLTELEKYIFTNLTSSQKIYMKLNNPLTIGERILSKYHQQLRDREYRWHEHDQVLWKKLQFERKDFEQQFSKDFQLQATKLTNIFNNLEKQSEQFITDNIQLSNIRTLLFPSSSSSSNNLQFQYEQQLYTNFESEIENIFIKSFEYFNESSVKISTRMDQQITNRLDTTVFENRQAGKEDSQPLLEAINGGGGVRVIKGKDSSTPTAASLATATGASASAASPAAFVNLQKESIEMSKLSSRHQGATVSDEARSAILRTAFLQLSSISLGSVFLSSTLGYLALAAIPGYFVGGGFLVLGLAGVYALPILRRRITSEIKHKIQTHQRALHTLFEKTMYDQREQALRYMDQQILRRYERYLEAEGEEVRTSRESMNELQEEFLQLRQRIKEVTQVDDEDAIGEEKATVPSIDEITPIQEIDQPKKN